MTVIMRHIVLLLAVLIHIAHRIIIRKTTGPGEYTERYFCINSYKIDSREF